MTDAGRPEEFKKEYIAAVDTYIKKCKDRRRVFQKGSGKMDLFEEKLTVNLPSIDGFSLFLDVSRKSLYNWKKKFPAFAAKLDKLSTTQKVIVINKTLSGDYNHVIGKLILSSDHGMKERIDETSDDKPIERSFSDEQVNRIAERIAGRKRADGNTSSAK